jgi:hypothetical protein
MKTMSVYRVGAIFISGLVSGTLVWTAPARGGDTIYTLDDGAECRDKDGIIVGGSPILPIAVDKTTFGLVKISGTVNGKDCFFYLSEVGLTPSKDRTESTSCPDATIGRDRSVVVGTRGGSRNCYSDGR